MTPCKYLHAASMCAITTPPRLGSESRALFPGLLPSALPLPFVVFFPITPKFPPRLYYMSSRSFFVLLLVMDAAAKDLVRAVLDAAGPDHRVPSQVREGTTLGSQRTKHQRFANRRELAAEYDVAPVDIWILPVSGKAKEQQASRII